MNSKIKSIKNIIADAYRTLGKNAGYKWSKAFVEAIGVGLRLEGMKYERNKVVEIKYKGHCTGDIEVDYLVHLGQEKVVVQVDDCWFSPKKFKNPGYRDEEMRMYMSELGAKKSLLVFHHMPNEFEKSKPKLVIRELGL